MRRLFVAVVVLLVACGGSRSSAPTTRAPSSEAITTTTTIAVSTTSSASTTSSVASTTTVAPTTTIVGAADWTPPCHDTPAGAPTTRGSYAEAGLDLFGPLASLASLDITLPTSEPMTGNPPGAVAPSTIVNRVEGGGVLVGVRSGSTSAARTSMLAVVRVDGTKRWVRCIAGPLGGVWVASPNAQPTTALVGVTGVWTNDFFPTSWQVIALADGSTTTDFDDAARHAGIDPATVEQDWVFATSATTVLVGHRPGGPGVEDNPDRLVLYDFLTNTMSTVPVPPEAKVATVGSVQFEFDARGEPMLTAWIATAPQVPVVQALYRGGTWVRDAAVLRNARSITVGFGSGPPTVLQGFDAAGHVVWSDAAFTEPTLQGESITTDGPLTVATVCTVHATNGGCTVYALAGVVTATGVVAWTLPGFRFVAAAANGWVLTNDGPFFDPSGATITPPGYVLLDDRTGKLVDPTQHWTDSESFRQGCCGEGEYVWVSRSGGVVFAANATHLRIWYPKNDAAATRTLSLP